MEIRTPSLFFHYDSPVAQLEPLTPLLFRHQDGDTLTASKADANGNIRYAYNPIFAKMATYTKIAWYENLWLHGGIIAFAVLLFLRRFPEKNIPILLKEGAAKPRPPSTKSG